MSNIVYANTAKRIKFLSFIDAEAAFPLILIPPFMTNGTVWIIVLSSMIFYTLLSYLGLRPLALARKLRRFIIIFLNNGQRPSKKPYYLKKRQFQQHCDRNGLELS